MKLMRRMLVLCIGLMGLIALAGQASALDNDFDNQLERWMAEVKAHPGTPRGTAAYLRAWYLERYSSEPARFAELTQWVLASPKSAFDLNVHALWALREEALRHGEPDAWRTVDDKLGRVRRWMVIGPFDNEGGAGEARSFAPERGYEPQADYQGKERAVRWKPLPPLGQQDRVNLGRIMLPNTGVTAYAYARIHSAKAQTVRGVFSSAGAAKLWVNNALMLNNEQDRDSSRLQDVVALRLKAGVNEVLVKLNSREGSFQFDLALLDASGKRTPKGLSGLVENEQAKKKAPFRARHPFSLSQKAKAPLANAATKARQKAERSKRADDYWTAAYLAYKYKDFAKEERLPAQLVDKALQANPDHLDSLLLAHSTLDDPNRVMRSLRRAMKVAKNRPEAVWRLANVMADQGRYWEAQELLRRALLELDDILLHIELANLDAGYGENVARLHLLEQAHKEFPKARFLVPYLANAYDLLNLTEDARKLWQDFESEQQNMDPRYERHYAQAIAENRPQDALAALDTLLDLDPINLGRFQQKARLLEDMGRSNEARATLELAASRLPDSPRALENLADFLHRHGETDPAKELWNRSLELVPQNPELKKYLSLLEENQQTFYDEFTRDAEALRQDLPAEPLNNPNQDARVLYRGETVKVFDNGLSSTAAQLIVQPLTEAGLRRYQTQWRYYSPDEQELKVLTARVLKADGRISQNVQRRENSTSQTYKIYFDHRAVRFTFPDAEPGDIIELHTVTHDIGQRNLFKDYFGKMMIFADDNPQDQVELNLLLPKGRNIVTNKEHLAVKPIITPRDHYVLWEFHAENLPALRREPSMPPWVEIADFVHVSTFQNYDEIGAWYWNLVKDQFVAKDDLKKKVHELVDGLSKPEDKVTAIYNWVVKNTRYVGLEFGIHGFKPYQVNDIFNRRYGDCKDKATLIVTMLQEAGIEANLVILRTSDLGQLGFFPPSLAMFNHAIAYVPQFDWYLDGTAEFSGSHELPSGDHDAQAMIVTPQGARPVILPAQDPKDNLIQSTMNIALQQDGTAVIHSTDRINNLGAASRRQKYQDTDRRRELLEKSAAQLRAGTTVESFLFNDLQNLEEPVRLEMELRAPSYATREGDTLVIQGVAKPLTAEKRFAQLSERHYPVRLPAQYTFQVTETITAPEGATWLAVPAAAELHHPVADFTMTVDKQGQTLTLVNTLRITARDVPLDAYAAFRTFCQEVDKAQQQQIRLQAKGGRP